MQAVPSNDFERQAACVPGSSPQLIQWIQSQLALGHRANSLQKILVETGWSAVVAHSAVAMCSHSVNLPTDATVHAVPEPNLSQHPSEIDTGNHRVQVLCAMQHPRLVLFGNVLTAQECLQLMAQARPALARSQTVADGEAATTITADRTSTGMSFRRAQTALIDRIEQRIARLLRWPVSHGEGLQVLHYARGARYNPHHDFFSPQAPHSASLLQHGGQRIGTFVIYLNDVPYGGSTYFPQTQLRITPRQGHAVFFSYPTPDVRTLTLHGGEPVMEGEKWIATKWLRQRKVD